MNIELTMHGDDHSRQLVRLSAGYDGTTGTKPLYALTTGAGCKRSSVVPGPESMQLWPRNACGGGNPCKGEENCKNEQVRQQDAAQRGVFVPAGELECPPCADLRNAAAP